MFIWRVNRNYLLIIFKPILTCCSDFTDFFPCFLFFPLFSLIFSPLVYYMWIHLCSDTDLILVYFHLSVPLALSKGHARGSFYPLWYVCKHFSLFHFLFNTIANIFFLSVVGLKMYVSAMWEKYSKTNLVTLFGCYSPKGGSFKLFLSHLVHCCCVQIVLTWKTFGK